MITTTRAGRYARCVGLALVLLVASEALPAPAQEVAGALVKRGVLAGNLYLAGSRIDMRADVDGDVVATGGRVSVGNVVRGDVLAAGGLVTVAGEVRDDVRVAGGAVEMTATIAGDALAAGGSVSIAPETHIGRRAWFAGGEVDVRGRVARSLRVAGATIRMGAEVQGDVELAGAEIEVLPSAQIGGNLTYRSPRPAVIHPDARIVGTVTHRQVDTPPVGRWVAVAGWLARIALVLSLALAGLMLVLLFPGLTAGAVQTLRRSVWSSLGLGFALLVAAPVAAVLLIATGIGAPLGLALGATYLVALLTGILIAVAFVGAVATRGVSTTTRGRLVLSLLIGVLVLGVLMLFPLAGALATTIGTVWGLGALALHGHRLYAGAAKPSTTEP